MLKRGSKRRKTKAEAEAAKKDSFQKVKDHEHDEASYDLLMKEIDRLNGEVNQAAPMREFMNQMVQDGRLLVDANGNVSYPAQEGSQNNA